mmetsp:Transcript_45943/g.146661  ORF Transcript_45943/g.146661 Transcript_45943/m.146661 type:complete len:266 (+) Transcript_45943:983-1780(+)
MSLWKAPALSSPPLPRSRPSPPWLRIVRGAPWERGAAARATLLLRLRRHGTAVAPPGAPRSPAPSPSPALPALPSLWSLMLPPLAAWRPPALPSLPCPLPCSSCPPLPSLPCPLPCSSCTAGPSIPPLPPLPVPPLGLALRGAMPTAASGLMRGLPPLPDAGSILTAPDGAITPSWEPPDPPLTTPPFRLLLRGGTTAAPLPLAAPVPTLFCSLSLFFSPSSTWGSPPSTTPAPPPEPESVRTEPDSLRASSTTEGSAPGRLLWA